MFQPGFKGEVEVAINAHQDIEIKVNGQSFIADLSFMNQFAVCKQCDATKRWAYHYPQTAQAESA
jgi:deoxycytidine triphosphate deaminase